MTSELSQMLDELMGKNRNAAPDDKGHDLHWSDKDVCKYFLCGFCPAELFTNTRADLGPCQKIHDEALRKTYEQSSRYMMMSYEEDFLHYLQQCMTDVERRIKRNHQRLQLTEEKNQKVVTPNKDVEEQINLLTQRIEELLQKIEQLGSEGNVEEAQGVMKLCDQLKDDRENLYNQQKGNVIDQYSVQEKQMEVCEVCGAFLIVGDAQSRVDDHLMGKQHMGYAKIKTQIEELKEKIKNRTESAAEDLKKRSEDGKDRDRRDDDKLRSRDRDRRSRDYDSSRRSRDDRDRHRRSRERDSRRYDDRRDRGYNRSRDYDRDGGRSRDYHSRSRDDRDSGRRSSHRSRSRDRDRKHSSRKHSRPRSRSREKDRESKKSRRSDSQDRKSKGEDDKKTQDNGAEQNSNKDNDDIYSQEEITGADRHEKIPASSEGDQ